MTITHRGWAANPSPSNNGGDGCRLRFFWYKKVRVFSYRYWKKILSSASSDLRKRLCDVAFITGCVMPNITDTKTRQNLVKGLIKLWSHSDGEVASEAIVAILRLGKLNVAEVTDIVKAEKEDQAG